MHTVRSETAFNTSYEDFHNVVMPQLFSHHPQPCTPLPPAYPTYTNGPTFFLFGTASSDSKTSQPQETQ